MAKKSLFGHLQSNGEKKKQKKNYHFFRTLCFPKNQKYIFWTWFSVNCGEQCIWIQMMYDMTMLILKIVGKIQYFTVDKNTKNGEFFCKNTYFIKITLKNFKNNASNLCFLLTYLSLRNIKTFRVTVKPFNICILLIC